MVSDGAVCRSGFFGVSFQQLAKRLAIYRSRTRGARDVAIVAPQQFLSIGGLEMAEPVVPGFSIRMCQSGLAVLRSHWQDQRVPRLYVRGYKLLGATALGTAQDR
jgi:hypothetical protein